MHIDDEKGYPWLFFYIARSWVISLVVLLLVIGAGGTFYVWYSRFGSDPAPDGQVGLGFALAGTICLVLAAGLYTLRRRLRKRAVGQLNAALNWHIAFAVMGLALLFMHSFGNFNWISGTYALYSMIALVVSGFVGRALDHFIPRLITEEVRKALTAQGEDRIETISQKLEAIVVHNSQEVRPFKVSASLSSSQRTMYSAPTTPGQPLLTSWDLAYISLEETPQEVRRDAPQYRFIPDRKSALSRPGALIPGAQEHISELQNVQQALQREQFYRYVIRYWRIFHIGLALLTIGLVIWHITYAMQLLLPPLLQR